LNGLAGLPRCHVYKLGKCAESNDQQEDEKYNKYDNNDLPVAFTDSG